jgi:CubicO group peptidase (beta-lactamase class C family)
MILALVLVGANVLTPLARAAAPLFQTKAQETKATTNSAAPDVAARLAAIEKIVEEQRRENGIPGLSLVIVKDDQVIYAKGFGLRDAERNLPVTPDTLFAIGSCTKAFTAMAAVMSQDEGKLSLDDSPKKYLPFFRINDPQIDEKITIRDLLSHRSGLAGTDLAWYTGVLNREEVIRVAGAAKPTAKLGEKFQYQNVMYSAAGEAVAKAQNSTWEKVITERLLRPLGMKASRLSAREMQQAPDHSLGYDYNIETKQTRHLPMRDLTNIAPAGAINSNARDMAQWLRLLLGGGAFAGKRLVSEKGFGQIFSKVTNIAPNVDYALGWLVTDWNGHKIATHGGGIDGFNSEVSVMPGEKLGFVLLTNVSQARMLGKVRNAIWENLAGKPQAGQQTNKKDAPASDASVSQAETSSAIDLQREVGIYNLAAANLDMEVTLTNGHLVLNVPGQPAYTLENIGGRRYKFVTDAPGDFFITFRPAKDNEAGTEAYLEQPQGNVVLRKRKANDVAETAKSLADYSGPLKDALGAYELGGTTIDITVKDGKVTLVVPGQPDYPLVEKEKDKLSSPALPDTYSALIKRDAAGKVSALVLKQPEGEFEFKRVAEFTANIGVDELMAKVIAAHGGETSLRKHKSLLTTYTVDFVNQGIEGEGASSSRAPNAAAQDITLAALGKKLGTLREFFDGTNGGTETNFTLPDIKSSKQLDNARVQYDFYALPNWKTLFKSVTVKKMDKVGGEDAYVVVMTPERGSPVTNYVSTKSFLIIKRDALFPGDSDNNGPTAETYSDYRAIDGVLIPFKTIQQSIGLGEVIIQLKAARFDVPLPDSIFQAQAKK